MIKQKIKDFLVIAFVIILGILYNYFLIVKDKKNQEYFDNNYEELKREYITKLENTEDVLN